MSLEVTLLIVKPDAVAQGKIGAVLAAFEQDGFQITCARMLRLTRAEAEQFYAEHKGKHFFEELVKFMSSGPCVPAVVEREGAIMRARELAGATDPAQAAPDTLRARFGTDHTRNAIHASDSPASAAREIAFFSAYL